MTEPRIQYAKTGDGVNIAYWTLGEGAPFVHLAPLPVSNTEAEWRVPDYRRWFERLAEQTRLVRYDPRGFGLSDRSATELSVDAWVEDLEAVVDHLGLEKFALFGIMNSGAIAIAYAAKNPQRVTHLILWCASPGRDSEWTNAPEAAQWESLMLEENWEFYTETMAQAALGWSGGETARQFAALLRDSIDADGFRDYVRMTGEDVTDLLPKVASPTLILHRRKLQMLHLDAAKLLSARIPGARLSILEGESFAPFAGDMEAVLATIEGFLGIEPTALQEPATTTARGGLATILFTDIESSTALTQRLGDAKAQELLRAHNTIVRGALKEHGGSEIKHTGDGIMASFATASSALECAVAIQRAIVERHAEPVEASLSVRIGLNAGEPVAEEQDLFGTAVQLASRICDRAAGGEILASDVVRQLAAGKGFLFSDRGDTALRGYEDPVRLYEVRWREEG